MRLLFFNPEHDLALAANDAHYTPPASARQMASDLERLPLLWAEPYDVVLLRDGSIINVSGEELGKSLYDVRTKLRSVEPWGWNPLVVRQLRQIGVPETMLPSEIWLAAFREISGRDITTRILPLLQGHGVVGEAVRCNDINVARAAHKCYGKTIFKQPWSGSGRGLHLVKSTTLDTRDEAWLLRTLRTQGYVMAEPFYDKVMDLAAEFNSRADGKIVFEGLSLFTTNAAGVYTGNLIATEEEKRRRIAKYISLEVLDTAINALTNILLSSLSIRHSSFSTPHSSLFTLHTPFPYVGPIGVDMMIVGGSRLHPCVEVNFRHTMGWVALEIQRRQRFETPKTFAIQHLHGHYMSIIQ